MTKLKYLENTYLFENSATIIEQGFDERGEYLIFDSTIFYPQGGGQASDIGEIIVDNKSYKIDFVASDKNGFVKHYGTFNDNLKTKMAEQKVDKDVRLKNASSHTAGHLISVVVEELYSNLKAVKGYHFLDGSYIEFIGEKIDNKEEFLSNVNTKIEELLDKGLNITIKNLSQKETKEQFGIDNAKNFRVMYFEGFKAIPCGGTHLKSTKELKSVIATKIKSKKDRVKVSYSFLQR